MPARRNEIRKQIWLICIFVFILSAGVRLFELPRWDVADLHIDGERLLATNDAYFWVAGAEGVNPAAQSHPMAVLLDALSLILPISLADIAFWGSILLAALVAVPLALWCDSLQLSKAMFAAPLLISLTPAFYNRTRLGFYDSDWATLFFPLLIGWLLGVWIQPHLRKSAQSDQTEPDRNIDRTMPAILILLTAIALPWHNAIGLFLLAFLGIAFLLSLFLGTPKGRAATFPGLTAVALVVWLGWIGAAAGLIFLWFMKLVPTRFQNRRVTRLLGVIFVTLLVVSAAFQFRGYLADAIPAYAGEFFGQAEPQAASFSLVFPDTTASIQETQHPDLMEALSGSAFHPLLGAAGILGLFILLRRKITASFFLPLLVLGLGSVRLGVRFTMYAAPAILLGLFTVLDWLLTYTRERGNWGTFTRIGIPTILLLTIVPAVDQTLRYLPVETVVDKAHAETLVELSGIGDPAGTIWTSWDYGYAAQHFSGMNTFADGRRNSGEYLFSLGVVFGSESIYRSADFIHFAAQHDNVPWEVWETWSETEWDTWWEALGNDDSPIESLPVPAYLFVQWEATPFLKWYAYYESWEFAAQAGQHSRVWSIRMPQELDLNSGVFEFDGDQRVQAVTIDVLSESGVLHYDFPKTGGPHLLVNQINGEVMLLDEAAYRSAFIQLLLLPVDELEAASPFHLVIEDFPYVRVFELH